LAHIQRKLPDTQVTVLYNPQDESYLQQVMGRFPVNNILPMPVTPEQLLEALS